MSDAAYERAYERDSHKHANTSIYERAYERDSHKHANTSTVIYEPRAYETPQYGILISTLIQAYMSVLIRGILISTLIQGYMSVLMRWILISTLIQAYI